MFLALVVGGILVYAVVDLVRAARRRRARRASASRRPWTEAELRTVAELERMLRAASRDPAAEHAAAPARRASTVPDGPIWTEDDQRWLESRHMTLRA